MDIRFSNFLSDTISNDLNIVNIALSAVSQASLMTNGISFESSTEYLGKNGHQAILNHSDLIMKELMADWGYIDSCGLRHSYEKTLLFYVRFYLHYWLNSLYVIDQAITKHSPENIYIEGCDSFNNIDNLTADNNSIFGVIVRKYVESNDLKINIIEEDDFYFKHKAVKKNVFKSVHFMNAIISVMIRIYRPFIKNKEVVLIPGDGCNMLGLVESLTAKNSNIFPIYLNVSKAKFWQHAKNVFCGKEICLYQVPAFGKLSSKLKSNLFDLSLKVKQHKNDQIFNFLGVDLRCILSFYINKSVGSKLVILENGIKIIKTIIKIREPQMAFSQHALGYGYALGEICSKEDIPSLLISHGTHVLQKEDKYASLEWGEHAKTIMNAHFSHTAIQSPMASEFFSSIDYKFSTGLKTGPLIYSRSEQRNDRLYALKERVVGKLQLDQKIIIHAGTPKGSNAIRPWVYETIDEYIRNINDLIDAIDCLHDVYLIVRFRASEGLNKKEFSALLKPSKNYGVFSGGVFDDYLSISDLLVSYSSTTIEEALQNDTVVLQYDRDDKYMHIRAPTVTDGESLNINPIYYCGHKDELENSLYMILNNINSIKSEKHKWDYYRYPIDKKLEWLDELLGK